MSLIATCSVSSSITHIYVVGYEEQKAHAMNRDQLREYVSTFIKR